MPAARSTRKQRNGAGAGTGQVSVYHVDGGAAVPVCVFPGTVVRGGLGYSVAVVSAQGEGKTGTMGQARNNGTASLPQAAPPATW